MPVAALVFGMAGLAALGTKLVDFVRLATNARGQRSAIVTQLAAWAIFVGLVFLYGASQLGATAKLGALTVAHMDAATKLIVGLALGSVASVGVDWKQALDNTDSSAKPPLLVPTVQFGPAAAVPATPPVGPQPGDPEVPAPEADPLLVGTASRVVTLGTRGNTSAKGATG